MLLLSVKKHLWKYDIIIIRDSNIIGSYAPTWIKFDPKVKKKEKVWMNKTLRV